MWPTDFGMALHPDWRPRPCASHAACGCHVCRYVERVECQPGGKAPATAGRGRRACREVSRDPATLERTVTVLVDLPGWSAQPQKGWVRDFRMANHWSLVHRTRAGVQPHLLSVAIYRHKYARRENVRVG